MSKSYAWYAESSFAFLRLPENKNIFLRSASVHMSLTRPIFIRFG